MPKFRKTATVEAHRWFKNGDHPDDYPHDLNGVENGRPRTWTPEELRQSGWEGAVVRHFRRQGLTKGMDGAALQNCPHCSQPMHVHGLIDTLEGAHIVCPGDWIITGVKGERYPCKPDIFEQTYEPV